MTILVGTVCSRCAKEIVKQDQGNGTSADRASANAGRIPGDTVFFFFTLQPLPMLEHCTLLHLH